MKFKLGDLIGYFIAKNDDYKASEKPLDYVVAKNGTMKVIKNPIGRFVSKVDNIPDLQTLEPGVYLDIPKIPFDLFKQMVAWFKAIYDKDKTESTIMVFYDKENDDFILWPPKQENSSASSKYLRDEDPEYTEMCRKYTLVMVNHSHPWNGVSVGPSGIDDKDEKEAMLYMVVGNVSGIPNVYVSACPDGKRMKLNFFDIFENPLDTIDIPEEYKALLKAYIPEKDIFERFYSLEGVTFPEEWLKQHKKYVYIYRGSYFDKDKTDSKDTKRTTYQSSFFDKEEKKAESYYSSIARTRYGYFDEEYDDLYGDLSGYGTYSGYYGNYIDDEVIDEKDSKTNFSLGDVIDVLLDLSEVKIAKILGVLIDEGYDDIMKILLEDSGKLNTSKSEKKSVLTKFDEAVDRIKASMEKEKENEAKKEEKTGAGVKASGNLGLKLIVDDMPLCKKDKKEKTKLTGITKINK